MRGGSIRKNEPWMKEVERDTAQKRGGKPKKPSYLSPGINPVLPTSSLLKRKLERKSMGYTTLLPDIPRVTGENTTAIKMQTPAVLDLTFIYTLIRRNPSNQII